MGDEDAVGVRPVRSHVSLTRLTVDTGVSPENHENWFGEFKIEVATSVRLRSPGPFVFRDTEEGMFYFDFTAGVRLSSSLRISSFCFIMILF